MKRLYFLVLLSIALVRTSLAQEAKPEAKLDQIVQLNGTTLNVKVRAVTTQNITYSPPGEDVLYTISPNVVRKITFASGRVQMISQRVDIQGAEDWELVTITVVPADVQGLVAKGEVIGRGIPFSGLSNPTKVNERAIKEFKQEAAKLGAHMILFTTEFGYGPGVVKKGIAYGYE
jgi:hypothetical protein